MVINGTTKVALISGVVTLLGGFVGVWGGREAANLEITYLKKMSEANTESISKLTTEVRLTDLHVRELASLLAKQADEIAGLKEDMKGVKQWRVEIQDLASKRGIEIPDLRRRIELLEAERKRKS